MQLLTAAIAWIFGAVIWRVLVALGVGVAVYTGLETLTGALQSYIDARIGAVPSNVLQVFLTLNGDKAINLIISAVSGKYTFGFASRRLVFSPPAGGGG